MAKLYAIIPANNINAWVRYHYTEQHKKKSDTQAHTKLLSSLQGNIENFRYGCKHRNIRLVTQ